MRLLIDECLHTSLTDIANKAGYEAHHVTRRGWSGLSDRRLRELVAREEFVFVTNKAQDFRKLMAEAELHAGLIVIVPNVDQPCNASCSSAGYAKLRSSQT